MTWRGIARRALWTTAGVTVALLFTGPLFFWLPVTPGFLRDQRDLIVLYRRPGTPATEAHARFPNAARAVESALGLTFTAAVPVVLCDTWDDLRRFTPWLPVNRGLGARTLPLGHLVYVTPLVRNRPDADVFVRHELVHVLLHQHMPLGQRLDGGRPGWLIEGLATYFGNPDTYPSGSALAGRARSIDVARLLREGPGAPGGPTLFYAESRDFIGWLDRSTGRERLRAFVSSYVDSPANWQTAFETVFDRPFDAALAAFVSS